LANAGALIDGLASRDDALWPRDRWPAMKLDRPLGVGAAGGHGPIRYFVEEYEPGRSVRFRFTRPRGFDGSHRFEITQAVDGRVRLRHVLEMRASGPALLTWPFLYQPLHDALLEDALDRAGSTLGLPIAPRRWSAWVKVLRWALRRRARQGKRSRLVDRG